MLNLSATKVCTGEIHLFVVKKTIDFPAVCMVGMCPAITAECKWDFCLAFPLFVFCLFSPHPLCTDLHLSGWKISSSVRWAASITCMNNCSVWLQIFCLLCGFGLLKVKLVLLKRKHSCAAELENSFVNYSFVLV